METSDFITIKITLEGESTSETPHLYSSSIESLELGPEGIVFLTEGFSFLPIYVNCIQLNSSYPPSTCARSSHF
jgi:hypothetical protein